MMTFGEKLLGLRKQNQMSQEELASKLSISRQAISKWELNNSLPETENIILLSQIFAVSIDYLLKDEEASPVLTQGPLPKAKNKEKSLQLMGIGCLSFSFVSLFVLWVLSKFFPAPIITYTPHTSSWKVGFNNFIWVHDLQGFLVFLFLFTVTGLFLIFSRPIKKHFLVFAKKFGSLTF